ncbi:Stk1 family PASTA domain-containing Ser/Thr kinase [Catenuloplanes atrovinosus]|uniref:non-specific serine/threonine protein kinase n=1 Tax=Catenuloplanes atrovinosus TaxID=137266 RepID=A0AAE4CFX4_9ACTN|nr:Stk1 family PASTA domain-containing Ser/Thr kinase [Catenuloplanes atrovinosus]MDR7280110.1 serine/threonine-protein kinase [Catenuloplanes atrovinosus]
MTAQARLLGGRYQVGELLGYGGMAEVHHGRDLRLGRDVAIKMLRTDLARDNTFQMRFSREAQNAAALNHPAIVAVYDTGEEIAPTGEKLPFIVMEFVNGRTLKEVLAAEGRLQPRRAFEIMADICAALEFSHRHGIIHRDIKPGNVMMTQTGQVKVMDFGIARALASGATTMTQTSAVIGTAQYLSPEQARGEPVDARSDVYAAGCVLFELVVGHPPFVGDSPVSVAYQHVREEPPTPSDLNPEAGPDLDAIALKALSKNPANRYQSAGEMRADLLRAATGRPVMATPVMREDETQYLGAATQMTGATRAIPQGGGLPPRPAKKESSAWIVAGLSAVAVLVVIGLIAWVALNGNQTDEPTSVQVANVVGMSRDDAERKLRDDGLVPALSKQAQTDNCTVGQVVDQDPEADASVDKGATVTLTMCAEKDTIQVPNLVGTTWDAAEKELTDAGLKPERRDVNGTAEEGQVVKVDKVGESVPKGTTIVVEVSRGNMADVPNVVNQSVAAATALLQNAGFQVQQVPGQSVPADQQPKVTDQSPNANSQAETGSTVQITVTVPQDPEPQTPEPDPGNSEPPGGGNPTATPPTGSPTSDPE